MAFGPMKEPDKFPKIVLDGDGFRFEGIDTWRVNWTGVCRITTHKLDLLTTDEIRLVFENDGETSLVEVSEEQPGFEQLKLLVEEKFGFPEGWWEAVMSPAFATNSVVLFVRAEQAIPADRGERRRSR